jgi:hypothetical protein
MRRADVGKDVCIQEMVNKRGGGKKLARKANFEH